jgi:hypothetical protein
MQWFDEMKGLQDLYGGGNPASFFDEANAIERGRQGNLGMLTQQAETNRFNAAMNPMKEREQSIANQTNEAQLPGIVADSSLKQDKAQISRSTIGTQLTAAQKKLIAEMDDNDIKLLENQAQRMAYSQDPAVRAQGERLMAMHKDVLKEREKSKYVAERNIELEKLRANNNAAQARLEASLGKWAPKSGSGAIKDIDDAVIAGKLTFEKAAVAFGVMADKEKDPDLKAQYALRRDQYEVAAQKLRQSPGQARPQVDVSGVTQGQVPTVGGQPPGPSFGTPPQQSTPAPTQYQPGQVYKGRTGNYQYKGGDPKDKNNWTKVN